ncbi:hypothetical protein WJX81_002740 [Elliptochloris bilobata]|uniref:Uncharacterized protein n=1 Tax=Elliptochloris bilobata TaxID=381761 RepID=A0AAW1RLR9_9CHLO
MLATENPYAAEVAAARQRLARLKERLSSRAASRRGSTSEPDPFSGRQPGNVAPARDVGTGAHEQRAAAAPQHALLALQRLLARHLLDPSTTMPTDNTKLKAHFARPELAGAYEEALKAAGGRTLEAVLHELGDGDDAALEVGEFEVRGGTRLMVLGFNRSKLASLASSDPLQMGAVGGAPNGQSRNPGGLLPGPPGAMQGGTAALAGELDSLLTHKSARNRAKTEKGEELLELIGKRTAKELAVVEQFRTEGGPAVREYCPHLTKLDCCRAHMSPFACRHLHFRRLVFPWTDISMGNCSYLDTCRHMKTCRFLHYELDEDGDVPPGSADAVAKRPSVPAYLAALPEPQWIKCDIRTFDWQVLGKFGVIMADPPWEIHQDLPYGTMADEEMRRMGLGQLQDEGVIFLWVTGRAMELGRECLEIWGYKRVDELVWVKTNQLQRLIRTGRTGHWLNHSKEHCLVGVKGAPAVNRNVDCDVLVAEVRETSRKPDEMYPLLERLSPGTRKLEIFARQHNVRPGWVSLGNQLAGVQILDPDMRERYEAKYGPLPAKAAAA